VGAAILMPGARHGVDAVAITKVETRPSSREEVVQAARRTPEVAATLNAALASQLFAAWSQLEEAYLPVHCRLARAMLDLADRFAVAAPDGVRTLRSRVSHDDLAAMIGAQRVSVSNAMAALRREGVVAGARGVYRIDTAGLASIAFGTPIDRLAMRQASAVDRR
jgi:CRP-like cAMP-binding protein